MKRNFLFLVIVTIALASAPVFAQKTWLGVQGGAVLPTGDLNEFTTSGGGGGVTWDFALSNSLQTRVDGSWLQFSSRDMEGDVSSKARVIPVRAGLHWVFGPTEGTRFYVGAMGGAYFQQLTTTVGDTSDAQDETFFGAAACVGVQIPVSESGNQLEINASYDMWSDETTSDGTDLNMGLVRLGVGCRFSL